MDSKQSSLLDEMIDADIAAIEDELATLRARGEAPVEVTQKPKRLPLPEHLPRAVIAHEPDSKHCKCDCAMVERLIRMLKEQCAHRHRFETLQHASRVVGEWISFYNHRRPPQALKMKTPAQAYALAT